MTEEALNAEFEDDALEQGAGEGEGNSPPADNGQEAAASQEDGAREQPEDDGPPQFDEKAQKFIEERIVGPKTARIREMEERLQAREQELEQLRSRLPEDAPPPIPELPDPWEDGYEEKIKARDAALLARAEWDRNQEIRQQQEYESEQRAQREQQERFGKVTAAYRERATKLEVAPKDLALAGTAVGQSGLPMETGLHILEHESGPLLTLYLAENPADLEDLRQMSPLRAAVHLETKILPRASKKKAPPPPPPADGVSGSGPGEKDDPSLKGARFG